MRARCRGSRGGGLHPFSREPSKDLRARAQTLPSTVPGQDVVLLIRGAQEGEGEASAGPSPGRSCLEVPNLGAGAQLPWEVSISTAVTNFCFACRQIYCNHGLCFSNRWILLYVNYTSIKQLLHLFSLTLLFTLWGQALCKCFKWIISSRSASCSAVELAPDPTEQACRPGRFSFRWIPALSRVPDAQHHLGPLCPSSTASSSVTRNAC